MLRTSLLAALAATSLATVAVGCGDTDTKTTPPPDPGKCTDANCIHPTPADDKAPACDATGTTQAINELFLGDTDRDGTANPTNGWKNYGFDLDGFASTKASTGLCKPTAGASPAAVYQDGTNGIDNSFGKNILPTILGLASDLSTTANESIQNGEFTIM
ncbi:MAG TPA: hypothetical protein PKA58_31735, partial [Polyangium sp.]|nr:hypothetical protein [Polyangium sp.]